MDQQKSSIGAVILAVIITALVVGGGMFWWQNYMQNQPATKTEVGTMNDVPDPAIYAGEEPEPYPCKTDGECQWGWKCKSDKVSNQLMCLP